MFHWTMIVGETHLKYVDWQKIYIPKTELLPRKLRCFLKRTVERQAFFFWNGPFSGGIRSFFLGGTGLCDFGASYTVRLLYVFTRMKYIHIKATYYLLAITYYQSPPQCISSLRNSQETSMQSQRECPHNGQMPRKATSDLSFRDLLIILPLSLAVVSHFVAKRFRSRRIKPTLPETNSSPLAMVGRWKFILRRPVFRCCCC